MNIYIYICHMIIYMYWTLTLHYHWNMPLTYARRALLYHMSRPFKHKTHLAYWELYAPKNKKNMLVHPDSATAQLDIICKGYHELGQLEARFEHFEWFTKVIPVTTLPPLTWSSSTVSVPHQQLCHVWLSLCYVYKYNHTHTYIYIYLNVYVNIYIYMYLLYIRMIMYVPLHIHTHTYNI